MLIESTASSSNSTHTETQLYLHIYTQIHTQIYRDIHTHIQFCVCVFRPSSFMPIHGHLQQQISYTESRQGKWKWNWKKTLCYKVYAVYSKEYIDILSVHIRQLSSTELSQCRATASWVGKVKRRGVKWKKEYRRKYTYIRWRICNYTLYKLEQYSLYILNI